MASFFKISEAGAIAANLGKGLTTLLRYSPLKVNMTISIVHTYLIGAPYSFCDTLTWSNSKNSHAVPAVFVIQVAAFVLSQTQNSLKHEDCGDILFSILPSHIPSVLQPLFTTFE